MRVKDAPLLFFFEDFKFYFIFKLYIIHHRYTCVPHPEPSSLLPPHSPEGWNGKGGGKRVQDGEHMYTCGGLCKV